MNPLPIVAVVAIAVGVLSALAYGLRRRWIDALLALVAGAALAGAVGAFTLPGQAGRVLTVSDEAPPTDLGGVRSLVMKGDGLRGAEWDDLPTRPVAWTAPATPTVRLDFPREVALGRLFTLALTRSWQAPGRLQLLDENGQVLAEARGEGVLRVQWLAPLAEDLVLRARLLDAGGKVVDEGAVPVRVRDAAPLQVRGRFGAPSFDLRTLDTLLADSNATIDWQVELGKGLARSETANKAIDAPDLDVVDAAWFEQAGAPARAALLARVADGGRLLVLGANARDVGAWAHAMGLALAPQAPDRTIGTPAMSLGSLAPASIHAGEWAGKDGLWTRDWQRGRIGWLAVGDWHRHAIEQPRALALWWQAVLDRLRVRRNQGIVWPAPAAMPLPHQRLVVCARGDDLRGSTGLAIPALGQALAWARRPDHVDAACAAVWPERAGWLRVRAQGPQPADGAIYVHADTDWRLWQRFERRAATARYAARTPQPVTDSGAPGLPAMPSWPFGVVFALAILALWWRERR
jgi:hypothetical protein